MCGGGVPWGQKKSARWISPRISQRALFSEPLGFACSVDFPPEISCEFLSARLLGLENFGAEAPQNEFKLPEIQETGSFILSLMRPIGPKIGHKR
jgi:hypothetical protein